jgi:glycosyltransferase involved in cell wall biosynthesis
MRSRKFVLVVPLYSSYKVFFEELCHQMSQSKWEVTVITNLPPDLRQSKSGISFKHIEIPRKLEVLKYLKASKNLKKIVAAINPQILHAHFQPAALVTRICNFKNIKLHTTSHGLIFNAKANAIIGFAFKQIELFIYKKFDTVWVLNRMDYDALAKKINNVRIYPTKGLGCKIEDFDSANFSSTSINTLKKALNIVPEDFILIFVGRLTNFKGFDVTVKAFLLVREKYRHMKLLVVGDFDPIHPSGLSESELLDYTYNSDIIKVGFSQEVGKYLSIANLLVFPSAKEGMPVNLMEAVSMGVPFITLNSRGCADVADNQKYGSVLDHQNVIDFAKEIERLYVNPEEMQKIRSSQLADRTIFNRSHFVKFQIEEYDKVGV